MPDPVPCKGKVLNKLSAFWMDKTKAIVPNHLVTTAVEQYPEQVRGFSAVLRGRSMLVQKAVTFPVE